MTVTLDFEGSPVPAIPGESIAAALTRAGIRSLRVTRSGAGRGVFCGMGVCQDCLVEVDGIPNRSTCMTKVEGSVVVRRQVALPRLPPAVPAAAQAAAMGQTLTPDVLVVGAGAAGLHAALAARGRGTAVLLVDARPTDGGQYFKQSAHAGPARDAQAAFGARLVAEVAASGAVWWRGAEVWGAFGVQTLFVRYGGQSHWIDAHRVVLATGANERPWPVPGWT